MLTHMRGTSSCQDFFPLPPLCACSCCCVSSPDSLSLLLLLPNSAPLLVVSPLTVRLRLIVSLRHSRVSHSHPPGPPIAPFFSPPSSSSPPHSVICPQVEYNFYLPRGVMNGRPLLKCLSITFECSLSLTSERHTRRA